MLYSYKQLDSLLIGNSYPIIFQDANKFSMSNLSKILSSASDSFNSIYPKLESFIIRKEANYRSTPIRTISIEEEIVLSSIFDMKDTSDVMSKGISVGNVRVFLIDEPITFYMTTYKYGTTENKDIISIFIGTEYYNDENNYLDLIINLADMFMMIYLKNAGYHDILTINPYGTDECSITFSTEYSNQSDYLFQVYYYIELFGIIMTQTNNDIINSFKAIKDRLPKINFLYYDDKMELIWEYAEKKLFDKTTTNSDFIELVKNIFRAGFNNNN